MPKDDPRSDECLVADLNAGDMTAFDGLYFRHRDWVVRLAKRWTGRDEDALDVLQETFSYFFRKFPGFVLTARMTTFLFPVVRNLSIAAQKKQSKAVSDQVLTESAAPEVQNKSRSELEIVLSSLPEAQRDVLLLRFVDGLNLGEIAETLSIPEGTVKSRLHNALAALKADPRIKEYFDGD